MMIFIGDSHIRAMAHGYMRLSQTERSLAESVCGPVRFAMVGPAFAFGDRFWEATPDGIRLIDPLGQRLSDILGTDDAVIRPADPRRFVFSMGFQPSYIYRARIAAGWTIDQPDNGQAHLSRAAFRAAVLHYNRHVLDFFAALRRLNVEFSVLEAPPPSPHYNIARSFGQKSIALLSLHDQIIRAALDARQITCEAPPDIVREGNTPDGYLVQTLHDTTSEGSPHGNGRYGELFLRKIFAEHGASELALTRKDESRLTAELVSPATRLEWDMRVAFSLANQRINATQRFADILMRAPDDKRARFGLAYALERSGNTKDAEIQYGLVTEEFPNWPPGWMGLSRVMFANRRIPEAAAALDAARALGVNSPDVALRQGAILEKLSRLDEARAVLRAALFDDPEHDQPVLKREWYDNDARLSPEGFFPAQTVPEPDPFERAAFAPVSAAPHIVVLGRVELSGGDLDAAERCFLMARELPGWQGSWNSYLGDINIRRQKWKAAETFYAAAVEAAPAVAVYARRLGLALERQKRNADARKVYLKAIQTHPKDADLLEALRRTSLALT